MSVTEFKRKSKRFYVFAGVGATLLPVTIVAVLFGMEYHGLRERVVQLEKECSGYSQEQAYVLTRDMLPGEKITSDMLKQVVVYAADRQYIQEVKAEELVGKCARGAFAKGTVLQTASVFEETEYSSDMRTVTYDCMDVNEGISAGDFVDIRIVYPNGEDYIVVNHKKVQGIQRAGAEEESQNMQGISICVNVTEEEILRIASAYVDTVCYDGTRMYAIAYLDQFQEPANVDYPVNPDVYELLGWSPNVVDYVCSEFERQKRAVLQEHMTPYKGSDMVGVEQNESMQDVIS